MKLTQIIVICCILSACVNSGNNPNNVHVSYGEPLNVDSLNLVNTVDKTPHIAKNDLEVLLIHAKLEDDRVNSIVTVIQKNHYDTIDVVGKRVYANPGVHIEDLNFDGCADFYLTQYGHESHGGVPRHFFLYNTKTMKYEMNNSLPYFANDITVDSIQKRIHIYCPYRDCEATYEYIDSIDAFMLVDGVFEVNP